MYTDVYKKLELWILGGGGVFGGRVGIPGTSDLDLGQKVGTLDFGRGRGIPGTSDLDLGQKVGTLDFLGGGKEEECMIHIRGSISFIITKPKEHTGLAQAFAIAHAGGEIFIVQVKMIHRYYCCTLSCIAMS